MALFRLTVGSVNPTHCMFSELTETVYGDIGGVDRWTWYVLGNLFALGAACPFVGSLSDLFGRRYVAIAGACFLILGNIVSATAHTMNTFIGGMVIMGVGAGINELTSLAVTSELAPTKKRGLYVSILVFTILPFCPSILWGNLIAHYGGWRWIGLVCGLWAFIGLALTTFFYFPPPRAMTVGLSRREILKRIDYVGGFLSIGGLLLFMMGVQWGGYQYTWHSAHVLAPLIIGLIMIIGFVVWETKFVTYPMFPGKILQEPRILCLTLVITFISGSNFFSVILFWPTQSYNVYGQDPWQIGIRNIELGFSILAGACIVLALLSWTKGHIRSLMVVSSVFMTAGAGAMAALNLDNLWLSYIVITIAGLGIGGIVVPASIISTIICPDELIATVAALTLSIRVLGGAIGYAIYYNVFAQHFVEASKVTLAGACVKNGITSVEEITVVIEYTAAGLLQAIRELPFVTSDEMWKELVRAGQESYAGKSHCVSLVSKQKANSRCRGVSVGVLRVNCIRRRFHPVLTVLGRHQEVHDGSHCSAYGAWG